MSGRERLSNRRIIKNVEDKGLPGIKVLEEEADKSLQRGRQALPHRQLPFNEARGSESKM